MNKKIIVTLLITLSFFIAGCTNKQANKVNSVPPNNKQGFTNISQPKDTSTNTISENQVDKTITQEDALTIVSKIVGTLPKGYHLSFDHIQKVDNKEYYVIHFYEVVVDNPQTGESHTATYEWYYVDKITGMVYKLDIASDSLIEVK